MTKDEYQTLRSEIQRRFPAEGRSDALAFAIVLAVSALSAVGALLSLRGQGWVWLVGQILFGVSILQWFILIHDLGHDCFFKTKGLNDLFGHVGSAIVMLPFYPWRYIHASHHVWTGWQDHDPTMSQVKPRELSTPMKAAADFCWRFWIPIFALSFSFGNFWNLPKLSRLWKARAARVKFVWSCVFVASLIAVALIVCPSQFLRLYGLSYLIYLLISDPLLLSQHAHIPQKLSPGKAVAPIPVYEQDEFTRSIVFPRWVSKYILLYFDRHGIHHYVPNFPLYRLGEINPPVRNQISWLDWLTAAKRLSAHRLLLETSAQTGIRI